MNLDANTLASLRRAIADGDPATRAHAVDALAAARDSGGLRAALSSRDAYVRSRAVQALAAGATHMSWCMARRSVDRHAGVRAAVADAARTVPGWLALRTAVRLAGDAEFTVRYRAVLALGAHAGPAARRKLEAVASADEESLIRAAATAVLRRRTVGGEGA